MKTLRSQMNDVEDQAAKISVEEQTHITTIQALEKDLASAKSETKRLKEDTERMVKAKGEISSQILEKQRKIASMDSDSSTLAQTLELIQRERDSLSARLLEKRLLSAQISVIVKAHVTILIENFDAFTATGLTIQRLQMILIPNYRNNRNGSTYTELVEKWESMDWGYILPSYLGFGFFLASSDDLLHGKCTIDNHLIVDNLGNDAEKNLIAKLESAKTKLVEIAQMKSELVSENNKWSEFSSVMVALFQMKQSIEQLKCSAKDFKTELLEMDIKTLEEEYKALLSDKVGQIEYLQSLQKQIKQLKALILLDEMVVKEVAKAGVSLGRTNDG
ncbi:unnamed protein product [Dovyalis caffra]|uniref:Uncharacterized protein n=1 Tax=Dovyalis caffra TaxID=77055 RepID=A0AAV1S1E9_9ROSI|nr:unnamed protein product [Dovyalis caffra]